ncbi:MAG: aldehyde dehydrogenase family protein [Actinophytocola sp.]|nr:aldehyde dehydrogenase family protein [Actinophytocola sp.]
MHTLTDTPVQRLDQVLAAAEHAATVLEEGPVGLRVAGLRAIADVLDENVERLVTIAEAETNLPTGRLTGEVARTTGQQRLFAAGLEDGSWSDVIIDTADPDATPVPRPDLRRAQLPLGPVLVFAAGNFPFAFSVAGGDTAAALAAGCPVVVKAHPGHPETSRVTAELVASALADAGLPEGAFALIEGVEAGVTALQDRRIRAGGFTGSLSGGRALHDIARNRPDPIPFFAEMGSVNPVFVTTEAVRARGEEIVAGFTGSYTLGVGQFCTKPGLLFLPAGHGLEDRLVEAARGVAGGRMLDERIHATHADIRATLTGRPGVRTLVADTADADGLAGPALLATDVRSLLADADHLVTECFGPTSIIVEYDDMAEAVEAASALPGSLTATIHAEDGESGLTDLLRELRARAGRLVWNGWPTGVAVAPAMHHGGPYPATMDGAHTSVGLTAIRRFQRPVCYQDYPESLLPDVLKDENPQRVLRRVNGQLTTEDVRSVCGS